MRVLTVNMGSSSVKLRLVGDDDELLGDDEAEAAGMEIDAAVLAPALERLGDADAVAHRFVHGGDRTAAAVLDGAVRAELEQLTPLAPLHQPKALAAADAVAEIAGDLPAVACFDTAFHAHLPAAAATYALPAAWRKRFALRRYGFHGLSHAYAAERAAGLLGLDAGAGLVTCHLGAGASLAAVRDGRSLDTTMGFSPLEGSVRATRSGSVDPGLVLWLLDRGLAPGEVQEGLEKHAGLKGLAGTADMREDLEMARQARAALGG
jgi:acetate kinase